MDYFGKSFGVFRYESSMETLEVSGISIFTLLTAFESSSADATAIIFLSI